MNNEIEWYRQAPVIDMLAKQAGVFVTLYQLQPNLIFTV
jgi:hypothetical protein